MNEYFLIYIICRLDAFAITLKVWLLLIGFIIIGAVCFWIGFSGPYATDEASANVRKIAATVFKRAAFAFVVGMTVLPFVPSTQNALTILAGGKTLEFANKDKSLQKIPGQTTAIVASFLQNELNKLRKNTESAKQKAN